MIDLKNKKYELRRIVARINQPEPSLSHFRVVDSKNMTGLAREVSAMADMYLPHTDCAKIELWEHLLGDEFDLVAVVADYGKRSATSASIKKAIAKEEENSRRRLA